MTPAEQDTALDHTLMALADPTRRAILQRLSKGEARISDIAQPFAMSFNSVSRHIQILERAKLVERHVVGREHHISLRPEPLEAAGDWIEANRSVWALRLKRLSRLLEEE